MDKSEMLYDMSQKMSKYRFDDGRLFYPLVLKDEDYNFILAGFAALSNRGFRVPYKEKISLITLEPYTNPMVDYYKYDKDISKGAEEVNFILTQNLLEAAKFAIGNEYASEKDCFFEMMYTLNKDNLEKINILKGVEKEIENEI